MSVPLDYLFPIPSLPPSSLSLVSPAVSPASTEALLSVLKDNHTRWHVFVNKLRFHNHAAHRAIALWALGADADVIRKYYEKDCCYVQPLLKSPELITEDNFNEHLGDERYFDAYIQFFAKYVKENGITSALEEYIFSLRANLGKTPNLPVEWQPQMLNRFLSGVLHPIIHTGNGAEFSLPGLLVEGLAETAVHHSPPGFLEPLFLFTEDPNLITLPPKPPGMGDPHALTILARVLHDTELVPISKDWKLTTIYPRTVKKYAKEIAAHVNGWNVDPGQLEHGWEKKLEEIVWTVVVLYGIAGWTDGRNKETGFTADFFLMHLVTSSIVLPSICALISPVSRARLLKAYLAATCTWALVRGRPLLDVKGFVEDMQQSGDEMSNGNGNEPLWAKWIELAKVHPDGHLTKTIRSLAGWARVFGSRRARLPLDKKAQFVKSGLVIDAAVANDQLKKDGSKEGRAGRAWRDWKNGVLISPTMHVHSSNEVHDSRRMSDDPNLSPITWREVVNEGCAGQFESLCQSGVDGTAAGAASENEKDYIPSTELPGSEYLDGGLFLRVAILTFKRMGWDIQDGKIMERTSKQGEFEFWDFDGFH